MPSNNVFQLSIPRLGFVRFINVFSVERLVSNLCIIWVDRFKLHANLAHFNRPHMKDHPSFARKGPEVSRGSFNSTNNKAAGYKGYAKTFVNMVKDNSIEKELSSAIVLDDDCLNTKDLNTSLLGRVKEFASFSNFKKVLCDEGFDDIKISYMGEFWVLLEFDSIKTKDAFRSNVGVGSRFLALRQASNEFISEGRIAWVEVEGIPFKFWSENTFNKIATKWGRLLDVDDQNESNFHSKRLCLRTQLCSNVFKSFKVVFRGKVYWVRAKEVPGWILEESEEDVFSDEGISNKMNDGGEVPDIDEVPETDFKETDGLKVGQSDDPFGIYSLLNKKKLAAPKDGNDEDQSPNFLLVEHDGNSIGQASKIANSDSIGPGRFKKSVAPCNQGSILSLMEEVMRVGQTMGYKMEGCVNNITEIIESQGATEAGLEEIQLGGSMYTWCHKSATKMSKLDRFFVFENLLNTCPNINAITLERYLSDHRPILLREYSCDYGPIPFRFFHYWIEVNGFDKLVMNSWYDAPSHGKNVILSFMSKLKFLKTRIKEWNVDYRSLNGVADKLKEELLEIDVEIDNGNGNVDIVARRLVIINELQCISKSQVAEIAQNIKIRWCVEGENSEPVKVKGEFFHHFSNNFGKPSDDWVKIDMNFPNTLSVDQKADLEGMVTIEEVKRVVWDCGSDKAPGPDGYTFSFCRHVWSMIEKDVFAAVQYFFNHGDIPKGCNSTFITLIPKIPGANMVKDFRPISLIKSFYKIIAKVLTNRLVGVLEDIVNEVQSAFIANRQISEWPFIVNEAIQC
nr:RNA-directed DNA polymerase, eukaryota [Tanacetum cinerariifolium]